jgi:hypothetical protein
MKAPWCPFLLDLCWWFQPTLHILCGRVMGTRNIRNRALAQQARFLNHNNVLVGMLEIFE